MKKALLIVSLLAFQPLATATCIITLQSARWTMSIHNSTPDPLNLSCSNSPSSLITTIPINPIPSGTTATAYWIASYATTSHGRDIVSSTCTVTDKSGNSIPLTLTFENCTTATPTSPDTKPMSAFTCAYPLYYDSAGDIVQNTYYYDIVEIYPSLTLTWNSIVTNLAKGQVMADKLAASLLQQSTHFDKSTAVYDAKLKKVTITLNNSASSSTDPYAGVQDGNGCAARQMTLQ